VKEKIFLFRIICVLIGLSAPLGGFSQQIVQLFTEDFNTGGTSFSLNTTGPAANTGINQWLIDNQYNGGGLYPNTTPQTNTTSGTIGQAPFSPYLHVHDLGYAGTATNCNYNSNVTSDRFTKMSQGFCTLGFTQVTMTFFYLAGGNGTSDYGELYYSTDGGGSWNPVGSPYSNTNLWTYQIVTNPAFDNQQDLRFGFRWRNSTSGLAPGMSFAIDDIIVVGTYDNVINPVTINVPNIAPNPVCQGAFLNIQYTLSQPLCAGTYAIEMSNSVGNFAPPTNMGVFNIGPNTTTGSVNITIPTTTAAGGCYRIRISRLTPAPAITGIASACFTVQVCPNTITTLQPVVTFGPDTLCVNSAIDVPFYSTGAFLANNQYIAQLSDANGSFANPQTIGSIPDASTYDPALGSLPGNVSGLVPVTAPGCNYYIRVISTSPSVIPPPANYFGPFCLKQCDIETNNLTDIQMCITANVGADSTVQIQINSWNNNGTYGPNNTFDVQVVNSQTYQVINTGGLGTVSSNGNGTLTLSVPGLTQLIGLLGPPGTGMYYIRIVSSNPNTPANTLGTLIRLTIGAPDSIPPLIIPSDSALCPGDILSLFLIPFKNTSTYQWWSPSLSNGAPFMWQYNPLMVQFNMATPPSTHIFSVRENNNGCWGPWADTVSVDILGVPNVNITGPNPVCAGDTVQFQVPFMDNTYYQWTSSFGTIIDTSNNVITMTFPGPGAGTIGVFALNKCGSANGSYNFNVLAKPTVVAGNDTILCINVPVTLTASGTGVTYDWFLGTNQVGTGTAVIVTPQSTSTYVVVATDQNGCKQRDTTVIQLYDLPVPTYVIIEETCFGDDDGEASVSVTGGLPPFNYLWNTVPTQNGTTATNLPQGTWQLDITDALGCVFKDTIEMTGPDTLIAGVSARNVSCFGGTDGALLSAPTGGNGGNSWIWSSGQTQASLSYISAGTYSVVVTDSLGCTATESIVVTQPSEIVIQINQVEVSCFGGQDGMLSANATGGTPGYLFTWNTTPLQTISNAFNLTAGIYQVTVTDGNGCTKNAQQTVTQPQPLVTTLSNVEPTCNGYSDGSIHAEVEGGVPAYSYQWNTTAIEQTQDATGLISGVYQLIVTDSRSCKDTTSWLLDQPEPLPYPMVYTDTLCFGERGALQGYTADSLDVCWFETSIDSFPVSCSHQFLTPELKGTRFYFAASRDSIGCLSARVPVPVIVHLPPKADFTVDTKQKTLPQAWFQFNAISQDSQIIDWFWEMGDSHTAHGPAIVYQYSHPGVYDVKLTVTDSNGCRTVISKPSLVEAIKDQFIVAPNAFSPNGDGQNDFFTITLRNILKFDIMIYDRWGNLLYQSQDPGFKWDGTVNNIPLPEGVYVYVITALSTLDDNMELNGSITLVR